MAREQGRDSRGVAPVVGVALLVVLVITLSMVTLAGIGIYTDERPQPSIRVDADTVGETPASDTGHPRICTAYNHTDETTVANTELIVTLPNDDRRVHLTDIPTETGDTADTALSGDTEVVATGNNTLTGVYAEPNQHLRAGDSGCIALNDSLVDPDTPVTVTLIHHTNGDQSYIVYEETAYMPHPPEPNPKASDNSSDDTGGSGAESDVCEPGAPHDIVLVMDQSGSMDERAAGGDIRKITHAKHAATDFVLETETTLNQIGVVSYSVPATLEQGLTHESARVTTALQELSPGGYTNIANAILVADQHLDESARDDAEKIMVVMTDGKHNTGDMRPTTAAEHAKSNGVMVVAIGYGPQPDETTLSNIASSDDDVYHASNGEELSQVYTTIANKHCLT